MSMDCPNCVTPWKCNGPHLVQSSSDCYASNDGIFVKEFEEWKFIPNEKSFGSDHLLDIVNTLNILNENKHEDEEN